MNNTRNCHKCKSAMMVSRVEHPYWHNNALLAVIDNVPSWVCQLCGNRYFEPSVEHALENMIQEYIKLGQTYPIPKTLYRTVKT